MYDLSKLALDLINCQKAEIERLNKTLVFEINSAFERGKAEAYKECIDKIQNQIKHNHAISAEWLRKYLDNLLKEFLGEYKPPKTETQIKFEAYHECIEKIKQRAECCSCSDAVNTIADNVLKDLEGEQNCE
jgi:hypothetical protein